jgi:hypothetical protein
MIDDRIRCLIMSRTNFNSVVHYICYLLNNVCYVVVNNICYVVLKNVWYVVLKNVCYVDAKKGWYPHHLGKRLAYSLFCT